MKKLFVLALGIIMMISCKPTVNLGETTTFQEVTKTAFSVVMPEYPTAVFLEVHSLLAVNETGEFIEDKIVTDDTEVVFRLLENENDGRTLYLRFENGEPYCFVDDKIYLGDQPMPHFIDLHVAGAIQYLKESGYEVPTRNVSLRHPTNLGAFEPQYVFGSINTGAMGVGIYSRKIYE